MKSIVGKILVAFLTASLAAPLSAAPKTLQTLLPGECLPENNCICLTGDGVDLVNQEMIDYEKCLDREQARKPLQDALGPSLAPQPWWADPKIVIGGIVVSGSIGLAIGAAFLGR